MSALLFLVRKSARGRLRSLARRMRTVKGFLSVALGALFLALLVGVQIVAWVLEAERAQLDPELLRAVVPPALLLLTLLSGSAIQAPYFTPAEVDFLFPAPLTRRALVLYSLGLRLGIQLLSGVWLAVFVVRYAPSPLFALIATVLGVVFVHTTGRLLGLAGIAAEAWIPRRARRWVLLGASVLLVLGAVVTVGDAFRPGPLGPRLQTLAESPAIRGASLVTRPFGELFAADEWGAALGWAFACLGVLAIEVLAILRLDVAFSERSLEMSRKMHARLQRVRSGGVGAAREPVRRRVRVPGLAFLGGAAPLARRQMLELGRNLRPAAGVLLLSAAWVAIFLVFPVLEGDADEVRRGTRTLLGMALLLPAIFGASAALDFRRDLDRMALLKSLPLTPTRVAVGQLVTVVLLFSAVQLAIVVGVQAVAALPPLWLGAVVLLFPMATWALLAADNWLFLLFPYRSTAGMQFVGKVMLLMMAKLLVLLVLAALAGGAWLGARAATGSDLAGLLAAAAIAVGACALLTWLVGHAFLHFDLSHEVPA